MKYHSTRGTEEVSGTQAILRGLAPDGGLYVPDKLPELSVDGLYDDDYRGIANKVISLYFDEFTQAEIASMVGQAYNSTNFDDDKISAIHALTPSMFVLELFHGRTLAFKDHALSLYPYLLLGAKTKQNLNQKLFILAATSGDTGKAAMEAMADLESIRMEVLYPTHGVSLMQKKQMQTQGGANIQVFGIDGNFDDAQQYVKQLFKNPEFIAKVNAQGYLLSSANSINVARLVPQIIYYYDLYVRLVKNGALKPGQRLDITVPTGNFGNILAGMYAKAMGLPLGMMTCASNENNILTDFIQTGVFDLRNRPFYKTQSPSMDILIPSNLERFLYLLFPDENLIRKWMDQLSQEKVFTLSDGQRSLLHAQMQASSCDDKQTINVIRSTYQADHYLIDPHTAVALFGHQQFVHENPSAVLSTASPFKFIDAYRELFTLSSDPFQAAQDLAEATNTTIPAPILALEHATVRFTESVELGDEDRLIACLRPEFDHE